MSFLIVLLLGHMYDNSYAAIHHHHYYWIISWQCLTHFSICNLRVFQLEPTVTISRSPPSNFWEHLSIDVLRNTLDQQKAALMLMDKRFPCFLVLIILKHPSLVSWAGPMLPQRYSTQEFLHVSSSPPSLFFTSLSFSPNSLGLFPKHTSFLQAFKFLFSGD